MFAEEAPRRDHAASAAAAMRGKARASMSADVRTVSLHSGASTPRICA
jgi:hypothetical protein